jgi:transposase-like protein
MLRQAKHGVSEYKARVVALVREGGKSVGAVARELDLTETGT